MGSVSLRGYLVCRSMTEPLSADEIAAIAEREAKAAEGPWERSAGPYYYNGIDQRPEYRLTAPDALLGTIIAHDDTADDTIEFIAHARTDIPRLVHDWRAQKATIEALTAQRDVAEAKRLAECEGHDRLLGEAYEQREKAEAEVETLRNTLAEADAAVFHLIDIQGNHPAKYGVKAAKFCRQALARHRSRLIAAEPKP